jgi:hypothetical protein
MKFHLTKSGKSGVNVNYLSPNPFIIQDICLAFSLLYRAQYLANYQYKNIITRYMIYSKNPLSRVKKEVHNSIKSNKTNSCFQQMCGRRNLPVWLTWNLDTYITLWGWSSHREYAVSQSFHSYTHSVGSTFDYIQTGRINKTVSEIICRLTFYMFAVMT